MIAEFYDLFQGNPDVVGMDDDGYGKPGPQRLDEGGPDEWHARIAGHLRGTSGIGVYPWREGRVHWGCVDLDEGSRSWNEALHLNEALRFFGITGFIERSRSKGYHVWVFAMDWVPAHMMRHALLVACELVDACDKEVNPKQVMLDAGQIGNFVRLPYLGGFAATEHQVAVDLSDVPLPIDLFVDLALHNRASTPQLEHLAKLYIPVAAMPPIVTRHEGPWFERLNRAAAAKLAKGPLDGSEDRSAWLMGLGYACAESGLDQNEVAECVALADERHCHKYAARHDADTRYLDIARKSMRHAHHAS